MRNNNIITVAALTFFPILFYACQEEQFTDKGFPEIETVRTEPDPEGGISFVGKVESKGAGGITACGFLWSEGSIDTYSNSEKIFVDLPVHTGIISSTTIGGMKENADYALRAFIKGSGITYYGKVIMFKGIKSPAPEISTLSKTEGISGIDITIYGKYFSYSRPNNRVWFGTKEAYIFVSSSDSLVVDVPHDISGTVQVSVSVFGVPAQTKLDYTVIE